LFALQFAWLNVDHQQRRVTVDDSVQKKMSPVNIFVLSREKCPDLNIVHKPASIWVTVTKFCTISPYRLTDFQFLQNIVTNFIFPQYSLTCWCMALISFMVSSCVDKQKTGF